MNRFIFTIFAGISLFTLKATPGLETFVETGFDPLKPMKCNILMTKDDGSFAGGAVAFELDAFENIQTRKFKVIDADIVQKPLEMQMNCLWKQGRYVCEWNEFYWVSIDPEKTWHNQIKDSSDSVVYANGLWLMGVKAKEPVKIQCHQKL